jgi:hypothetical protein
LSAVEALSITLLAMSALLRCNAAIENTGRVKNRVQASALHGPLAA